ncbi:MAG: universal stress protein [Variovorax sp.]|nr:universal stress protein [Variovorax sp.]
MYHRILVPVDGSKTSALGLQEAIRLAAEQQEKASLHLLHVVDDFPMLVELANVVAYNNALHTLREYGEKLLSDSQALAAKADVKAEVALREVTGGRAASIVLAEAKATGCDLIVMGTHGRRGFSRLTLGSDAELVARGSPVPVLLVRHPGQEPA